MAVKRHMDVYKETWRPLLDENDPPKQPVVVKRTEKWLHERKELLFGSVVYKGKHLGTVESVKSEGKETVKRACFELLKQKGQKLPEVEIAISVRSIIVTEIKTKIHICKHKLQRISYCSEDTTTGEKIFAFIAKKSDNLYQCYCFETQSLAHRLTLTVGQAFQLAWERSQEAKQASEAFVKEMKKIKARKSKEDYGKKLAELMVDPEMAGDDDILPDMNFKRAQQAKKYGKGKKVSELIDQWQHLTDTLQPLRDEDLPLLKLSDSPNDIATTLATIQSQLEEWTVAKNPFQPNETDIQDALKELDSALYPLGSDSLTLLSGDSQTQLHQQDDETTKL